MTKFNKLFLISYIALVIWYTLDLIGIKGFVSRDEIFSISGVWELILISICIGYFLSWKYIDMFSGIVLLLWGYLQYDSHWRAFLFGESPEWLRGYYRFFSGMYRFYPESSTRAIPDAYHTILGLLLAVNIIFLFVKLIKHK
jgi:hypothetical protein